MEMKAFSHINLRRCNTWHNINDWSPSEWVTATVGELGEAANLIKKLNRFDRGIQQAVNSDDRSTLIRKIGYELADTFTYLDLLAQRLGISLEDATICKFNFISEREGLPHRIVESAGEVSDCARSHPHERMSVTCELRTEIARLKALLELPHVEKVTGDSR